MLVEIVLHIKQKVPKNAQMYFFVFFEALHSINMHLVKYK